MAVALTAVHAGHGGERVGVNAVDQRFLDIEAALAEHLGAVVAGEPVQDVDAPILEPCSPTTGGALEPEDLVKDGGLVGAGFVR